MRRRGTRAGNGRGEGKLAELVDAFWDCLIDAAPTILVIEVAALLYTLAALWFRWFPYA